MSLCTACYWNTANDFFEPLALMKAGQVTTVDECAINVHGYPKMNVCPQYESAHRMDED